MDVELAPAWLAASQRELSIAVEAAHVSAARGEQALAVLADLQQRLRSSASSREQPDMCPPPPRRAAVPTGIQPRHLIRVERLTGREAQVLGLVAHGHSNRGVAAALGLSPRTVERHIATIYRKLQVHNRAEATRYALEHAVVS